MNVLEKLSQVQASSSPKQDEPASEYVRVLAQRGRPGEVLPFPRVDANGKPVFEYRMQILSAQEMDQARISAERYTRERLKEQNKLTDEQIANVRREAWSEIYNDAKCIELLQLAMREPTPAADTDPPRYRPLFPCAARMREMLTTDEISALFVSYDALQYRYGPTWRLLDEAEIEAVLARIEEGAESYPFLHLPHDQLVQLSASLAARLRNLKTDIGSSGSGSSDTATESSQISDGSVALGYGHNLGVVETRPAAKPE